MTDIPDDVLTAVVSKLRLLTGPTCSCRVCLDARALACDLNRRMETDRG